MYSMLEILIIILSILSFFFSPIFRKDHDELEGEVRSALKNPIHIKIEQIGEIYYAWKDNDFIFQSKEIEEVIKYIKEKFPKNSFLIESNRDLEKWLQTKKD